MLTVDLKAFALTGIFGTVRIGMKPDEVRKILGEPDGLFESGGHYSGFLYGGYEFHFLSKTGELWAIQNDHLLMGQMTNYRNDNFRIDPWFMSHEDMLTRTTVKEILNAGHILYTERMFWGAEVIWFGSGVYLDFGDSDQELLNAIRFFPNVDADRNM